MKEVKGLRITNWWLQSSHRDGKYGIKNAVSDTAITAHVAGWVSAHWG